MIDAKEKAFSFRMPAEVKAAAVALTKTYFDEPKEDGSQQLRVVSPSSINEALIYLLKTGSEVVSRRLTLEIEKAKGQREAWKDFVQFFMDNPDLDRVTLEDLQEGSSMRRYQEIDDENNKHTGSPPGTSREEAFEEMSNAQKLVIYRTRARDALLEVTKG